MLILYTISLLASLYSALNNKNSDTTRLMAVLSALGWIVAISLRIRMGA